MAKRRVKSTKKVKKTVKQKRTRKNPVGSAFLSKQVESLVKKGYRLAGSDGDWYFVSPIGYKSGPFFETVDAWSAAVKFERIAQHEIDRIKAEQPRDILGLWSQQSHRTTKRREEDALADLRQLARLYGADKSRRK